ncbi:hypothetical protein UF68_2311 [Staphylococcus warneri]|nr:hypothetical protein UF68_2311 [Staphylococcus warneri]
MLKLYYKFNFATEPKIVKQAKESCIECGFVNPGFVQCATGGEQ